MYSMSIQIEITNPMQSLVIGELGKFLRRKGIGFSDFKDHVLLESGEVRTGAGATYTVFTPYSRKWKEQVRAKSVTDTLINSKALQEFPSDKLMDQYAQLEAEPIMPLEEMGFAPTDISIPHRDVTQGLIKGYKDTRNFPSNESGTSKLGIHFRFGTISIREKARKAAGLSETYLNELIWRDFYSQILDAFQKLLITLREKYKFVQWRDDEEQFSSLV